MFAPLRMSGLIFRLARSGKPALRPATRAWHPGAAACGQVHLRSFCADGPGGLDMRDMRDSIKSVAAALSALRYGPPAVEKILSMLGSKAKSSTTWPAGKTVKIAFHEMDSGKDAKTFVWKPDKEYFHEVIMKAATGIGDFDVSYQDKDGDMLQLDATKPGIESFLADHCQHESPRLKVEWRHPTTTEKIQIQYRKAKDWLTGEGCASDQAVKEAQEKVEGNGGKIAVSSGSGRSCIQHKGYHKEEWPVAVEGLKAELELSPQEEQALLNAARREEGRAQHFRQKTSDNKITAQHFAYHTICQGDKIDLIYGKHEESMEVSGAATALPGENSIQYDGTNFAVWPPASPHSKELGTEMKDLVVEIPSGWQLVDSTQEGFDNILQRVITPYGWHTSVLVTSGPDGQLKGWWTSRRGSEAGNAWGNPNSDHVEKKDGSRFHIKVNYLRLLIQAKPAATPELINDWKRFVQLSAQREWSQQLGGPQGRLIQE